MNEHVVFLIDLLVSELLKIKKNLENWIFIAKKKLKRSKFLIKTIN